MRQPGAVQGGVLQICGRKRHCVCGLRRYVWRVVLIVDANDRAVAFIALLYIIMHLQWQEVSRWRRLLEACTWYGLLAKSGILRTW